MNYAGTDLKFKIIPQSELLELEEQYFEISFKNRYGRVVYDAVKKEDCFCDNDGNYYFTIENVKYGVIFASFICAVEDDDYNKQEMVLTDLQKLTNVGDCCTVKPTCSHECGKHIVTYEQVWTVSIDGEDYLCGSDGKYILTSDGKRICFKNDKQQQRNDMGKVRLDTMTADEFKVFIEGRKKDGTINTVPELMDAVRGISDDETVKDEMDQQTAEIEQKAVMDSDRVTPEQLDNFEV